jgi:hypothetical protein
MKLPIHIARKLQQIAEGERQSSSSMKHAITQKMLDDGVLQTRYTAKTKGVIFTENLVALTDYLHNHFGINNLVTYIEKFNSPEAIRSDNVHISSNSKLTAVRTFKGFLINSYQAIEATLNGNPFHILPTEGSFTFVSDYESFDLPKHVTVVGLENPENFRHISRQQHLFTSITPLFICRYPYSNDIIKWLKQTPNPYLHFGDIDFEGINIYLNEYKKHLEDKASFFIPEETPSLLIEKGNRDLYSKQLNRQPKAEHIDEPAIVHLIQLFHQYKKVLEQEVFIK